MATLNLDSFGEIIDKFLTDNAVQMMLTMPEGTEEVSVEDNVGLGSVVQFYILLQAFQSVGKQMAKEMDVDRRSEEWRKTVKALLQLLENELIEAQE